MGYICVNREREQQAAQAATQNAKKNNQKMAEVVQLNLERMVPELEELRESGIFNEVSHIFPTYTHTLKISTSQYDMCSTR